MNAILTLIKLQFKAGFSTDKSSPIPKPLKFLMFAFFGLVAAVGLIVIYGMVTRQFAQTLSAGDGTFFTLSNQFFTYTFVFFHGIQTLFIIPILLKNLDINNERETLLRLPVSRTQIFVSKVVVTYLYQLIFTVVLMLPILTSYGIYESLGLTYWLMIPFVIIILPCFPLFFASILLYPIMVIIRTLKTHSMLSFIAYVLAIGIIFYIYTQLLTTIAMAMVNSSGMKSLLEDSAPKMISTAKLFVFQNTFTNALVGGTVIKRILYLLLNVACAVAFAASGVFILNMIFHSTFKNDHRKKFTAKNKNDSKVDTITGAIVKREIKNIFRSTNYSFQFFMIIVLIPFFVFFCTNIASYTTLLTFREQGQASKALEYTQDMIFGIALFVVSIMLPLANSFAATNISREAGNIYHTKVIPVSYRRQLMIKFFICLIPTLLSLFASGLLLLIPMQYPGLSFANPTLTISEALMLILITSLMSIGFISIGTLMDLKRPLCSAIGNASGGELTTTTRQVNFIIILGLILGILIGLTVIFEETARNLIGIDLMLAYVLVPAVMAVVGFTLLLFTGDRKYYKLEQ